MKNINEPIRVEEILCISFNQDYSCMAAGTERGFIIFNTNPFKKKFFRGKNNLLKLNINRFRRRNRNSSNVEPNKHNCFSRRRKKTTFSSESSDNLG